MSFGVATRSAHLNVRTAGGPSPKEINWTAFKTWNNNKFPDFAGRYFLGSPYLWAHGEGAALHPAGTTAPSVGRVAPIQRADESRQKATGDEGVQFGDEDGWALGEYVGMCVFSGELEPATNYVRVYLEVADGTALSPDYWTAWCSALFNKMVVASGPTIGPVTIPKLLFPFLPCVLCKFAKDAGSPKYKPESGVTTALDNAGASVTGRRARCYGFWARAFDNNAYHAPQPVLQWTDFDSYTQKLGSKTEPVPVLVWRHMDEPDQQNPQPPQARRLSLDATREEAGKDVAFDSMLKIQQWEAGLPFQFGVDKGRDISGEISCLTRHKMTLRNLPATVSPGAAVPLHLDPVTGQNVSFVAGETSFVFRYYGTSGQPATKNLTASEARAISRAGVEIVSVWEKAGVGYLQVPAHLVNANNGKSDAKDAFTYARQLGQPANTPIYFAIDCNVNSSGVDTGEAQARIDATGSAMIPTPAQIKAYFQKVAEGYAEYLQEQGSEAVPYYTGVFACRTVFDLLYVEGLATHFWQVIPPSWGDVPPGSPPNFRPNLLPWPHANAWQVSAEDTQGENPAFESSGVLPCRQASVWDFEIGSVATGGEFKISVDGVPTAGIKLSDPVGVIADAVKAILPAGTTVIGEPPDPVPTDGSHQWTLRIGGARNAVSLMRFTLITTLNRVPALKTKQRFGDFVDLDVAWGDTGGWTLRGSD